MKILKYIPLHFIFFQIIGIILGFYLKLNPLIMSLFLLVSLLLLAVLYFVFRNKTIQQYYFSLSTFFIFILIGMASITFQNNSSKSNYYTKHILDTKNKIVLRIDNVLKSNNYYDNYTAQVLTINNKLVVGKIKLNILKGSIDNAFTIDAKILVFEKFKPINKPLNPYVFNYKNYLARKQVYHQITTKNDAIFILNNDKTTLKGLAFAFREKINRSLKTHGFKGDELAIINALLLGKRQEISKEILQNYQNAGAIHILAVSGLHVGIILLLLNILLKPFERFKNGNLIKLSLVVLFLWIFAFIAGLSASVVRAVTMFTAVAVSLATKNRISTYKTLIISVFFLLLFNPFYLFEVGFQLSYLAVFFIVWIQPILYKIWQPKSKLIDYPWQLFTVSIAAQLGVLPLSLYYFHQFPSLFFVANLIIIPFLGVVLGLGILVILLSLFNVLPSFIANAYEQIIFLLNSTVASIAKQESFLFQNISFNIITVVLSYLLIIFFFKWVETKKTSYFKYVLIAFILFQSNLIIEKYNNSNSNEFVIFNKARHTVLVERKGGNVNIAFSSDRTNVNNSINAYLVGTNSQVINTENNIKNVYNLHSKKMLVIDSLSIYKNLSIKPEIILLKDSPNLNLERLIKEVQPKIIIADASNYKSYVLLWQKTCKKHNITLHYTVKDGAFVRKY